jgi:flavorubredoxin
VGEKGWEGTPLMRIENKVEEVRFKIQSTQVGAKPKAKRT